jgi:hypothetical protein
MPVRKTSDETDLRSYYEARVAPLAKRILDAAEDLVSAQSIQQRREFEDHIKKRLQNGAKFIPRKRQSR